MRKFTIVTGHGKLEFIKKENGNLELVSVNGQSLSKVKLGELGKREEKDESSNIHPQR